MVNSSPSEYRNLSKLSDMMNLTQQVKGVCSVCQSTFAQINRSAQLSESWINQSLRYSVECILEILLWEISFKCRSKIDRNAINEVSDIFNETHLRDYFLLNLSSNFKLKFLDFSSKCFQCFCGASSWTLHDTDTQQLFAHWEPLKVSNNILFQLPSQL